jgi:hypothetical protein
MSYIDLKYIYLGKNSNIIIILDLIVANLSMKQISFRILYNKKSHFKLKNSI